MYRREFLHHAAATSLASGLVAALPGRLFATECAAVDLPRTVVNVMLRGGADFRYLFMPAPSHPDGRYLEMIWDARRSLYDGAYANYQEMFEDTYLLATDPATGFEFGILGQCEWLHAEFREGRVAVVANAYCGRNRRHDQSILNADAGEPELAQLNFERSGWGGRLVEALDGNANVVELGQSVSVFSKGSIPGLRLDRVVHAENTRDMALAGVDPELAAGSRRNVLARALLAWYEARSPEVALQEAPDWPFHAFFRHREALQEFGLLVEQRLEGCGSLPYELADLALNNADFAQQCRNLYDACQMPDLLDLRVMSMSYGGWDTHDNEATEIGGNLSDLFGTAGGFAATMPLIDELAYLETPARENLVFYFASDFGRQLRANGSAGTDHGRGTYSLVLGASVRGGVYGEMFPEREISEDGNGQVPMTTRGADILGLTSTEHIMARACDWAQEGTSELVFPDADPLAIEEPGLLDELIRT